MMWKVYNGDQYKYYTTFQEAKALFRQNIKDSVGTGNFGKIVKSIDIGCQKYLGDSTSGFFDKIKNYFGISEYIRAIEAYCQKYYGSIVPQPFQELKNFLINYVTDPDYPADPEHFKFEAFEDDNVRFYVAAPGKTLYITTKNKDIRGLFLDGRISIQLTDPSDEYIFSLKYEQVTWAFSKEHTEEFRLVSDRPSDQSSDNNVASKGDSNAGNEKPYTVENFTSGKSYAFATVRGARNKMRALVAKEFGEEGVAKITRQIDRYCKTQYPDGAPKQLDELKTILAKLVTDPQFPSDPAAEMDLVFADDNLEIYTLPSDGTLNIQVTNPKMKTKFPEASIIVNAASASGLVFTLDNGRDAETDPKYIGIDIEVFDEELEESIHDLKLDSPAGPVIGTVYYTPTSVPQSTVSEYSAYSVPIQNQPQQAQGPSALERAELNIAKGRYDSAVNRVKMHPNSRSIYEAEEKKAHADYMQALTKTAMREAGASKGRPLQAWERAELNGAKARYDKAIAERKRHPESDRIYESLEKKAYSDYMRIMAKYAGRE